MPEAPAPPPTDDTTWARCAAELRASGTRWIHLGTPHLQADVLKVELAAGHDLAQGQLDLEREGVAAVLSRCYPQVDIFDAVPLGTATHPSPKQLVRMAQRHPPTRRVLDALDARVRRVREYKGEA